jgi:hypothetical protein
MPGSWRRLRSALAGRFDGAVLRACEWPAGVPSPTDAQAMADLRAWCLVGAGGGGRPWLNPGAVIDLPIPLAFKALTGSSLAQTSRLAAALCLDLDGSVQLHALGSASARWALRLRVKAQDAAWWRARQPADPWDTGYARTDTQALTAWPSFRPRRPTLVVLAAPGPEAGACRAALLSAQAAFDHPVRVLSLPSGDFAGAAYMPA